MKILLVGNGVNMALSNDGKKYDVLRPHIRDFLELIGYVSQKVLEMQIRSNSYKAEDAIDMSDFKVWLGPSGNRKEAKAIFKFYEEVNFDAIQCYDLELIAQLYFSSLKYQNSDRKHKKEISFWITETKKKVIEELSKINDVFEKKTIESLNSKYDYIITTNYDLNLENSGIKNVFHAHGDIKNPESIELITFKKYRSLLEKIKSWIKIDSGEIQIDIFGISLFNEVHILNVLLALRMDYKEKFKISQYIYANNDNEFNEQEISNLYLKFFYGVSWGYSFSLSNANTSRFDGHWTLSKIDQVTNPHDEYTFLSDALIKTFLNHLENDYEGREIDKFKFIINFCKDINVFSNTEHLLSEIDSSFTPSTIEINWDKIPKS